MPLFMDYHHHPGITLDGAKKAHLGNLAVQAKYNVKYRQFWVNEEAEMVFCLMEGPDKESCEAIQREINDLAACNIIEVDHGLGVHKQEEEDTGFRFILSLEIVALTSPGTYTDFQEHKYSEDPRKIAQCFIQKYQGKNLYQLHNDSLVSIFMSAESVVQCAIAIRNMFMAQISGESDESWNIKFKMGISVGQPPREHEDSLFKTAIKQSSRFCKIAENGEILAPVLIGKLSELADKEFEKDTFLVIGEAEQLFIEKLFDVIEGKLSDSDFNVESLSREIGVSRPHLYRKIQTLTGVSPISFIRDLKLSKALFLIKQKHKNISEIALEVGFNNPSYFAKCFQDKYGIIPSRIAV